MKRMKESLVGARMTKSHERDLPLQIMSPENSQFSFELNHSQLKASQLKHEPETQENSQSVAVQCTE